MTKGMFRYTVPRAAKSVFSIEPRIVGAGLVGLNDASGEWISLSPLPLCLCGWMVGRGWNWCCQEMIYRRSLLSPKCLSKGQMCPLSPSKVFREELVYVDLWNMRIANQPFVKSISILDAWPLGDDQFVGNIFNTMAIESGRVADWGVSGLPMYGSALPANVTCL